MSRTAPILTSEQFFYILAEKTDTAPDADEKTLINAVISFIDAEKFPKVLKDWSKVSFDLENIGTDFLPYKGIGGVRVTASGIPYLGLMAGGDWETPVYVIVYYDGTNLRGYVPTKGNIFVHSAKAAFGTASTEDAAIFLKKHLPTHPMIAGKTLAEIMDHVENGGGNLMEKLYDKNAIADDINGRIAAKNDIPSASKPKAASTKKTAATKPTDSTPAIPAQKHQTKTAPTHHTQSILDQLVNTAKKQFSFAAFVDAQTKETLIDIRVDGHVISLAEVDTYIDLLPGDLEPIFHPHSIGGAAWICRARKDATLFQYMEQQGYLQDDRVAYIRTTEENKVAMKIWSGFNPAKSVWMIGKPKPQGFTVFTQHVYQKPTPRPVVKISDETDPQDVLFRIFEKDGQIKVRLAFRDGKSIDHYDGDEYSDFPDFLSQEEHCVSTLSQEETRARLLALGWTEEPLLFTYYAPEDLIFGVIIEDYNHEEGEPLEYTVFIGPKENLALESLYGHAPYDDDLRTGHLLVNPEFLDTDTMENHFPVKEEWLQDKKDPKADIIKAMEALGYTYDTQCES